MKVIHKKLRGSANYGPPCRYSNDASDDDDDNEHDDNDGREYHELEQHWPFVVGEASSDAFSRVTHLSAEISPSRSSSQVFPGSLHHKRLSPLGIAPDNPGTQVSNDHTTEDSHLWYCRTI